ncbi:MAG: zf-HC2 domain-containing protein [Desulfobacterales bacterium]
MVSCIKCRKQLNAYLDGELEDKKRAAVERHLAVCPSCRMVLQSLQDLEPALLAADVPAAPWDLTSRILAAARAGRRGGVEKSSRRRTEKRLPPGWALKGASAVALIVGLTMGAYMGWQSFGMESAAQSRITASVDMPADNLLYAYDAMGAAPSDSIEAAVLSLVIDER